MDEIEKKKIELRAKLAKAKEESAQAGIVPPAVDLRERRLVL